MELPIVGTWGQTKICVPPKKMKYDNEMVMCRLYDMLVYEYDPTCLLYRSCIIIQYLKG